MKNFWNITDKEECHLRLSALVSISFNLHFQCFTKIQFCQHRTDDPNRAWPASRDHPLAVDYSRYWFLQTLCYWSICCPILWRSGPPFCVSKLKFASQNAAHFEYQTLLKRLATIHCEQEGWGSSGALPDPPGGLHLRYSPSVHKIADGKHWTPSQKEHAMFCKNCLRGKNGKKSHPGRSPRRQDGNAVSQKPAEADCKCVTLIHVID